MIKRNKMIDGRKKTILFYRRETVRKEEEAHRAWNAKFDPWLVDEYRKVRFIRFFINR